jgi:hypothetical protein
MLLVVLFTLPFLQYSDLGDFVVKVILTLMMIGTVRASDPGPRYVMKVTALGAVWLVLSLLHQFNSSQIIDTLLVVSMLALGVMVLWLTIRKIALSNNADVDSLAASVYAYFLLGFIWALFYVQIEIWTPGSFRLLGESPPFVELTYFSFVTLTTLGFGDITAATAFARNCSALEATTGALYLAIFVARIITIYQNRAQD